VGGLTFRTWEEIPKEYLEAERLKVPKKQRPAFLVVEAVGRVIAQTIRNKRGYSDEAYSQIISRLHGAVSLGQVQAAIRVLVPAVYERIKKPTKGKDGQRGRAAHYAFNPRLAEKVQAFQYGADPQPIQQQSVWDESWIGVGSEPDRCGMSARSVRDDVESVRDQPQPSNRSPNRDFQYLLAPIDGANRKPVKQMNTDHSERQMRALGDRSRRRGVVFLQDAILDVLDAAPAEGADYQGQMKHDDPWPSSGIGDEVQF
jgi:hypothetical protein